MTGERYLPKRDYDALADATRDLVSHPKVGGCSRAAADITRGDAARLSRYGNRHESMRAPIDVIADLEAAAGQPIVTSVLAELAGFHLVPKQRAEGSRSEVLNHLSGLMAAFADIHLQTVAAVADDTVDTLEKLAIRGTVEVMQRQLARFARDLDEQPADGVTPLRRPA